MKAFSVAFPVLPGKSEAAKEFAKTLTGPRHKEFEASEKRLKISKEALFLQKTPQGDSLIVYFEADDVEKAAVDFPRSQDPFDRWFKDQVKAITGVDINQAGGPPPEQILSYGY